MYLWVFEGEWALKQKPVILPKVCSLGKKILSFFTKPLPPEFMGSGQQNPVWLYGNTYTSLGIDNTPCYF